MAENLSIDPIFSYRIEFSTFLVLVLLQGRTMWLMMCFQLMLLPGMFGSQECRKPCFASAASGISFPLLECE